MQISIKEAKSRLFIHDGPRVLDLIEAIYRRYFEYAKYLEDRVGGDPNLQYIITTTTLHQKSSNGSRICGLSLIRPHRKAGC